MAGIALVAQTEDLSDDDHPQCQIIIENRLARQTALLLQACPDLWNLLEQPPKIAFTDTRGSPTHHTFDYMAEFRDSSKQAIAVKPEAP